MTRAKQSLKGETNIIELLRSMRFFKKAFESLINDNELKKLKEGSNFWEIISQKVPNKV